MSLWKWGPWVIVFVVVLVGVQTAFAELFYYNEMGSYYSLAVDASTAQLKLEYLKEYRVRIEPLNNGYAAWLFRFPDKKMERQVRILDSIIQRLERISTLDKGSFEYQQALYQINRNDLCHRGSKETTDCFREEIVRCRYKLERAFFAAGLAGCI